MGKAGAFKTITRQNLLTYEIDERVKNFNEIYQPILDDMIIEQSKRCMECGTPFCHGYGCPLGNMIPDWNDLVYKGKWQQALKLLEKTSNFPEFTGRLCPALCESACTLGIAYEPVTVRYIELAIIEKGFKNGWIVPEPPYSRTGKKIAVIGSGPAGLAAADELNKKGHAVEVFERNSKPGGLLRYGIPDFKLEKQIIDRRIHILEQEGIIFTCGVEAGTDISIRYLKNKYDALLLAIGSSIPRDLLVPGRDLQGIYFALDYLSQQNRINEGLSIPLSDQITAENKNVVVIGGGDTGADCVGTAIRQGAKEVIQIEILPKPPAERTSDMPWPLHPRLYKKSASHEEGGVQHWSVMTNEFIGNEGRVAGLSCSEVELKDGTFTPKPGTEFNIDAQLVILATGFISPELECIIKPLGIETNDRSNIVTDINSKTSESGVFAAGDAVTGPSLVVKAIAQGREAAEGIDQFLKNTKQ